MITHVRSSMYTGSPLTASLANCEDPDDMQKNEAYILAIAKIGLNWTI